MQLYFLSIYLFVLSNTISSLRQIYCYPYIVDEDRTSLGFPGSAVVKNPPAKAGDLGLISGLGRSPGSGNGNPLQYSCLGNPMDRSLVGHSPNGCKESDTTKWLCACMGAFTLKYDDRILGFHFEHRGISATDSFSFDFFWKFVFKCSYAFFFLSLFLTA